MAIPEMRIKMAWYQRWIFALLSLVGVLAFAVAGLYEALQAEQHAKGSCAVWHDIAAAPVPPKTSEFGLRISADSRYAVLHMGCSNKTLPPVDPRVAPYLAKLH